MALRVPQEHGPRGTDPAQSGAHRVVLKLPFQPPACSVGLFVLCQLTWAPASVPDSRCWSTTLPLSLFVICFFLIGYLRCDSSMSKGEWPQHCLSLCIRILWRCAVLHLVPDLDFGATSAASRAAFYRSSPRANFSPAYDSVLFSLKGTLWTPYSLTNLFSCHQCDRTRQCCSCLRSFCVHSTPCGNRRHLPHRVMPGLITFVVRASAHRVVSRGRNRCGTLKLRH